MFKTETQLRVRYAETDQMGVVYHSNFFVYFEVARAEAIRQIGFTYKEMENTGVIMPVVEATARYLRPALYDDFLTIITTLKELPTNHKMEFTHEVYNAKQELLATGKILLYFMDAKSMQKTTLPDAIRSAIEPYFQ